MADTRCGTSKARAISFARPCAVDALAVYAPANPGQTTGEVQAAVGIDKNAMAEVVQSAVDRELVHIRARGPAKLLYPGAAQDGVADDPTNPARHPGAHLPRS